MFGYMRVNEDFLNNTRSPTTNKK